MRTFPFPLLSLMVVGFLTLGMSTMGRSQPRLQTELRRGMDSPRLKGMPHQMLDEMRQRTAHDAIPSSLRKAVSRQSQIDVIDTAIVKSNRYRNDTTRHLYSFDASGKRLSDVTQLWKSALWLDTLRESQTYDVNGKMLTHLSEYWENGQWLSAGRAAYTYDANGNMLFHVSQGWENGQWVNYNRHTFSYDANGNRLSYLYQVWQNGQWVNSWRYTYAYVHNRNVLSELHEQWWESEWRLSFYFTCTYDTSGNRLSRISIGEGGYGSWDTSRSTWTYNTNGNMLSQLNESLRNGQWAKSSRYTYAYDAYGNNLTEIYELWDNSQWENVDRKTNTYDAIGDLLSSLWEYWQNGEWLKGLRYLCTYDAKRNLTSFWSHRWDGVTWVSEDIPGRNREQGSYEIIDGAGNSYRFSGYNFTLAYKTIVTGVVSECATKPENYVLSQNYPNPFNPVTTIEYEFPVQSHVTLAVYNLLGQELAVVVSEVQTAGYKSVEFNASSLPSGVYLYRLQAGDFVATKKFVVLK